MGDSGYSPYTLLRSGEARVALVGGIEACIDPLSLASFHAMKALSTRNDAPELASRSFDQDHDGFVMGEGAGLLVIETLEHAQSRGARPPRCSQQIRHQRLPHHLRRRRRGRWRRSHARRA
jgi:hypothetical protein